MGLPLYRFHDSSLPRPSPTAHQGLVFDKFIDGWDPDWGKVPEKAKKALYEDAAKRDTGHLRAGLEKARGRQRALVVALGGGILEAVTDWRFVSGLGTGHPFETGFIWHRTLAVPYLPGSSVKGMVRAWAEDWGGVSDPDEVRRLFGPGGEEARRTPDTGAMIVLDGLPLSPPRLEVDIMNPHYGPYYMDPGGKTPPADYYSPVPVFFLAVAPGQAFEFALAPRPGAYRNKATEQTKADLKIGMRLLQEALENIGAGGKTAVGYGYFKPVKT